MNLDCIAVTVENSWTDSYILRPYEKIHYFDDYSQSFPVSNFYMYMQQSAPELIFCVENRLGPILHLNELYGSWLTDYALYLTVEEIKSDLEKICKDPAYLEVYSDLKHLFQDEIERLVVHSEQIMSSFPEKDVFPGNDALPPKLIALIDLLISYDSESLCAIVFVRERITAKLLEVLLSVHPVLSKHGCLAVVGQGMRKSTFSVCRRLRNTLKAQKRALESFANGTVKLIIATQVAEEGIDVSPCNLVIRYDFCDTLISYIQSRGRGRAPNAQFVIMASRNDPNMERLYGEFRQAEVKISEILSCRTQGEESEIPFRTFTIKENGIVVTSLNAEWLINEFCSLIPMDAYGNKTFEWDFIDNDDGMRARVTLPSSVPVVCRSVTGPSCKSRKEAKALACFELLQLLESYGQLDGMDAPQSHQINSTFYKPPKIQTRTYKHARMMDIVQTIPEPFQTIAVETSFHLHAIQVNGRALNLGILTSGSISSELQRFQTTIDQKPATVSVVSFKRPLHLCKKRYKLFTKYHTWLFRAVLRKQFGMGLPWVVFCVPLDEKCILNPEAVQTTEDAIDWAQVVRCYEDDGKKPLDDLSEIDLSKLVLVDRFRYRHIYLPQYVDKSINPKSPPRRNGEHYFESIEMLYKYRFLCKDEILSDQPILMANTIDFILTAKAKADHSELVPLIPQLLTVHPVEQPFMKDVLFLPHLLTQVMHYLVVSELRATLNLQISVSLLKTACTAPSAQLDSDYERMETLGDSFLKLHLSLHAFTKNPLKNEGVLTSIRMEMENNGAFFNSGVQLGLDRYILVEPISRSTYLPPHWPHTQKSQISEKVISDVLEAITGAAVVEGGEVLASQTAKLLIGPVLEDSWDLYKTIWKPNAPSHPSPVVTHQFRATLDHVERVFGYMFKNPGYLFQAVIHSTYISEFDCYQRLEFLGDSVIGYLAMRMLYDEPELYDCDKLSYGRSLLVCNQFLGWLALDLGLYTHLRHMNDRLGVVISACVQEFEEKVSTEMNTGYPWEELSSCPKVIADLFESLFGAIFLDSGMDISVVSAIWRRLVYEPYWPLLKHALELSNDWH